MRFSVLYFGASNRNRTCNLLITNQLHCQLCYTSGNSFSLTQIQYVCQCLISLLLRHLEFYNCDKGRKVLNLTEKYKKECWQLKNK